MATVKERRVFTSLSDIEDYYFPGASRREEPGSSEDPEEKAEEAARELMRQVEAELKSRK